MILGFAFKSPEVVKFLIPAHSYAVCLVPSNTRPQIISEALAGFTRMPVASRKRVYLYKSVSGLLTCLKNNWVDASTDYHIVFDALSILSTKTCVKIIDVDVQKDATWQLKKTLSNVVSKSLETLRPGVDAEDIKVLQETQIFPEDLIHTDKKSNDLEKSNKTKSLLHVIQDLQSKNADKRNAIAFWICAGYAGALLDTQHVVASKQMDTTKWSTQPIRVRTYAEKSDKTARQRIAETMRNGLMQYGFEIKKSSLAKVMDLIGGYEYKHIMRALCLMQELKYTSEKASNATGANVSAVALIWRYLHQPEDSVNLCVKHKSVLNPQISIPKKFLKALSGQDIEVQAVVVKTRKKVVARAVPAGLYTTARLAITAGLVGAQKTPAQVQAISGSPMRVIGAPKYNKNSELHYKITSGSICYMRFGGKKYKLIGT